MNEFWPDMKDCMLYNFIYLNFKTGKPKLYCLGMITYMVKYKIKPGSGFHKSQESSYFLWEAGEGI